MIQVSPNNENHTKPDFFLWDIFKSNGMSFLIKIIKKY